VSAEQAAEMRARPLPNGWSWIPLGQYVENHDGRRVPISRSERESRQGAFPYYGASGVIDTIDGFTHDGEFVLIGEDGANLLTRSKPLAFLTKGKVWVNNHAHVLRCKPGFSNAYLAYYINSINLSAYVTGTAQPKLSQSMMNKIPIPVAPPEQQIEIVAELEKQFSRLDEAVANLQRVKANLKRYKASVLKAAVEGRLVETEAALARREGRTYETGEQLLQRTIEARSGGVKTRRGKADLAAMPSSNVREISDGWVWTTTGQVCECIVPNRDKPKTFSGDIPWLTLPDFDDSEITVARSRSGLGFTESEIALYRAKAIPADSVVMSCVGRFGISAVLTRKAVINQQLHAFLPSEGVASKYLAYVLRTREQEMLQKSTATTIAYLNKENCNSVTVPLPPRAEQVRIVAEVDRHLSIIREVEAEVDANLQRAQALRQATLSFAFSGG
jgi:type I restriction enzyme S subunit